MKKIGVFYGTTTGSTAEVAHKVAEAMGVSEADVHNVAESSPSAVGDYDVLLFGASTWGDGDLQDDMHDFIDGVKVLYLGGKKMALFGSGDESMSHTFCNAVGRMYKMLKDTGITFIGDFNTDGYDYEHTDAEIDGRIVGLLIDNINHPELTDARIKAWVKQIETEI